MSFLKSQRSALSAHKKATEVAYAELEALGTKASGEQKTKVDNMIVELEKLTNLVQKMQAAEDVTGDEDSGSKASATGAPPPQVQEQAGPRKTLGQRFIESKEWKERRGNTVVADVEMKANEIVGVSGIAGAAQFPVFSTRQQEVLGYPRPGLEILAAITTLPISGPSYEYRTVATSTNNAAPTQELSAKPQSAMTFNTVTANVRTIPHYMLSSTQVLDDEPLLMGMVDDELSFGCMAKLQSQCVVGDGTGVNLLGMLNAVGINTRVHKVSGRNFSATDSLSMTIRKMFGDIRIANGAPSMLILNPTDAENLELERDTTNNFLRTYDPITGTVWRVKVQEHGAITAGTGLAADMNRAVKLLLRQGVQVSTGYINDGFVRNEFAILAEVRAALALQYPAFLAKATALNT